MAETKIDDLIRSQIPSWNQLFGQNSQCECNECESMTGAPAYLAHILHFAEQCKPNDNNETPYDLLVKRVPYLPYLPLTCENTNTEIPYIQLVLEILEYYAANNKMKDMPAYDSGSNDWEKMYLETCKNAYRILSTQCFPFSLPYHQPLDVIRTYLSHSKTSFEELLSVFDSEDTNIESRIIKEYLSLSDEEYSLLTEFKIGGNPVDVFRLYGFNTLEDFQTAMFGNHGVSEFLQKTGLLYAELIDILNTQFINPRIYALNFLQTLFLGKEIDGQTLFTSLKDIRSTPSDDPGLNTKIQNLLDKSNKSTLDVPSFKKFIDDNFDIIQHTVIIIPDLGTQENPGDPCDFINSKLGTILSSSDATVLNPLDDITFKRLYFFIRLFKKTQFKVNDLDTLLYSSKDKGNDVIIKQLAYFTLFDKTFQLMPAQFVCLYDNTNPNQTNSVYAQLFLNSAFKNINSDFIPDVFGNFFSKQIPIRANGKYHNVLLSALKISNEEMDTLTKYLTINNPDTFNLSFECISVFYSYTLLASLLKISLSELLNLINAFGKSDALRTYDNVNSKFNDTNINSTKLLYEIAAEIADSGFTIEELLYVLGLNNNNPVFQISPDKIKSMLVELQQAFELIKQQNPSPVDSDITETLMSNKLLSLYEKDVTSQLIGMLNNNIVYAITLTDKPDLIIPDSLKYKIIYDKLSGRLQVFGVLTKDDKNIFSSEVNLDSALQPIWDKPFNFLKSNFSSFIVDDNTRNILLDRTGSTTSLFEKLKNLRDLYQPYLINQLGKRLVVEKISLLLSLNQSITELITQSVIDNLYSSAVDIANEISTTTSYFPDQKVDDFTLQLTILNKSAFFISKFGLTINEIKYLLDHSADFYNMNFITFTVEHWQQVNSYCFLKKLNRTPQLAFIDLFALASSGCSSETIVNYISLLTGWQKDEISSIITTYNYDVNSFKNPKVLRLMNGMFSVANKTSIKGSTLAQWAKYDTQFDSLTSLSSQIRDEIIQQFIPAERSDANSKINSTLLENQRNALVDYILTLDDIKNYPISNVEELSGYFLTDLLMSSCMPVTRMVHAIAIVQSCFKRWLMGLEIVIDATTKKQVGVSPSQIDDAIWEAMSFFRTWQVSMVFLINPYPYLSYKYLIEKSDAAKTLEATLLKSDITQRTVEDAYRVYLQDMCDIANLEVVAMYIDDSVDVDGDPATKFIHVISKTRSAPYKYYYSTKNEAGRWSFLQNIPVAIRENDGEGSMPSGSHLIFTKFKDRYYLFMPEFIKRQDQDKTSQNTDSNFGAKNPEELSKIKIANISTSAPVLHEIKLGVSEFFQGKWSKKTYLSLSGDWSVFNNPMLNPPSDCIFNIAINKDSDGNDINLDINLYNNFYGILTMTFYSINSALILSKTPVSYSTGSGFYQNLNLNQSNLKIRIPEKDDMSMDVFNKAESGQFISYSPQFSNSMETIYDQPFFFYDINRCYYATAKPFTHIEEIPGESYLKGVYDMPATISLLKKPKEAIFLPLHINQSKTWKL